MATNTAATSPGTMADDATVGTITWTNYNNAKVSDAVYASAANGTSHYLKATNFGFAIPAGATINGILVEIERYKGGTGTSKDTNVKIVKADGTIGTTNKALALNWLASESYFSYGSSSDLWGETWTYTDINDIDFGVVLNVTNVVGASLEGNSFVSILNGYIKIKDIKVGDKVVSYNEKTKQTELKIVEAVISHPISNAHNRYFYIYSNGQIVKATENHRFYVGDSYIRADELQIGDNLLGVDLKNHRIEKIEVVENTTDLVWDLTIQDNHNFFANGVLAHNSTAFVDHIRITVYYTEAVSGATGNMMMMF